MTNFQSKHVALLKNKNDCADVYCVTLIDCTLLIFRQSTLKTGAGGPR